MIGKISSTLRARSLQLAVMAALSLAPYSPTLASDFPKQAVEMTVLFGGSISPTISGLAATGAPMANATVTAKCASGAPVVGTTAADGSLTLSLSGGQAAPCLLQAVRGSPSETLHGFAAQTGRANITTLTDLVVAKAMAGDPALAFGSFDATKASAIKVGLDAAQVYINANVSAIVGKSMMTDIVSIKFGG